MKFNEKVSIRLTPNYDWNQPYEIYKLRHKRKDYSIIHAPTGLAEIFPGLYEVVSIQSQLRKLKDTDKKNSS